MRYSYRFYERFRKINFVVQLLLAIYFLIFFISFIVGKNWFDFFLSIFFFAFSFHSYKISIDMNKDILKELRDYNYTLKSLGRKTRRKHNLKFINLSENDTVKK